MTYYDNSCRADQLVRGDTIRQWGAEIYVGDVSVDKATGMVGIRKTPFGYKDDTIYLRADQFVTVVRNPRFDLADKVDDPIRFINWLKDRGWKIVPNE